jgi:hypothetical protein
MPNTTSTTNGRPGIEDFANLGNVVPAGYVYYQKLVTPGADLAQSGAYLKWYDIAPAELRITARQGDEARLFLKGEIESQRLKLESELGFVCLHRCPQALLLLVITWRNTNEIWESSYVNELERDAGYEPQQFATAHRATYCVWELAPVWHERNAWVRFLSSRRDEQAKLAYISDRFSGSA